jgi:hypothetical protein
MVLPAKCETLDDVNLAGMIEAKRPVKNANGAPRGFLAVATPSIALPTTV